MKGIGVVWRTVRYLTARQLVYQALTRLRVVVGRGPERLCVSDTLPGGGTTFLMVPAAGKPVSWVDGTFTFLNQPAFMPVVDWNFAENGKLWTYNLNYFDFLNQSGADGVGVLPVEMGLAFVRGFIGQILSLRSGLEPYPTSLRIINWVHFLSRNKIQDTVIDRYLYAQTALVRRRLEFHIDGNHLLENAFALLTAALYFQQRIWYRYAVKLVRRGLSTQLLPDGGHYERSPMYHQILLDRLLDTLLAVNCELVFNDPDFVGFLSEKAGNMLGWLRCITFQNGDIPLVNDAASAIAPSTAFLRAKAEQVGLVNRPWPMDKPITDHELPQHIGYRKFRYPHYELLVDAGAIGPDHQPGHAHADTFSFVLYVDNQPLIVDSGTSTYEIGARRTWERSTAAHNTVEVRGMNSSEVWSGFRVGRRARTVVVTDLPATLTARHNGYRHMGILHERTWSVEPERIRIVDRLVDKKGKASRQQTGIARLHFHPDMSISLVGNSAENDYVRILFVSASAFEVRLTTYEMADGFNQLRASQCLEITFKNCLETTLTPIR